MKKLILMFAVAGFFVACNSANSSNVECDKAKQTTEEQTDVKKSDCGHTHEATDAKEEKKSSDCGSAKTSDATDCPHSKTGKKTSDCGATADKVNTPC